MTVLKYMYDEIIECMKHDMFNICMSQCTIHMKRWHMTYRSDRMLLDIYLVYVVAQ